MTPLEAWILTALLAFAGTVWVISFLLHRKHGNDRSGDFKRDMEIFKGYGLNLMDAQQLAEVQMSASGPVQISVFAPSPLEDHSPEVYASTLAWVKQHLDWTKGGPGALQPKMYFWYRASESNPKVFGLIQRLHKELGGDRRIVDLIECVMAPDHLFFIDITVHKYVDSRIKVFMNPRVHGVTRVLHQLPEEHGEEVAGLLASIHRQSKAVVHHLKPLGIAMAPDEEVVSLVVKSWEVSLAELSSTEVKQTMERMFETPVIPLPARTKVK